MENKKGSSRSLQILISILVLLLAGSIFYIFKVTSEVETVKTQIMTSMSEKELVMKDLQELKNTYDAAIAENTSISDELIQERNKVVNLMASLSKSKGDLAALLKYKAQYIALQSSMKILIAENDELKRTNSILTIQRDSTIAELSQSKESNNQLAEKNTELAKVIDAGSKLAVLNLQATAYRLKGSGKEIETDKASKTDAIKISFTIAENKIAKPGTETYYVQVIDSQSNVIGDKKSESYGENSLAYSFISTVKYENKTVEVAEILMQKKFVKGTYFINIYNKGELVSKTDFTLK